MQAPSVADLNQLSSAARSGQPVQLELVARALTDRYPGSGVAWKALGVALQMQGKNPLPALQCAGNLLPDDAEAHRNLGIAQCEVGRIDEAVASLQRAVAIKPNLAEAHVLLGTALRHLGRFQESAASYRHALEISPTVADIHRQLGDVLSELGLLDESVMSYQQALSLAPELVEAHNNLGNVFAKGGRLEDAVASYRRVLELQPNIAEVHSNLGKVLLDLRHFEQAIACCRRALMLNPELAEAYNNLANALLDIDRPNEAIENYQRALDLKPDFPEGYNALANALRGLGRFDAAVSNYQRALELKPDFAEAYTNLGVALRLLGHTAQAEENCRRALELDPNSALTLSALGEAQADRGEFAQAENLLKRAVAIDPDLVEAWISLGRLRKMTPSDTAWLAAAQRLLQQPLRPREAISLRYAIGKYFDDLKEFEQAFTHYEAANDLTRRHSQVHDRQAWLRDTQRLMVSYDRAHVERLRTRGVTSTRPIFIIGMPRSGTSLAEQIIASHPAVFGAGELGYWHMAAEELKAQGVDAVRDAETVRPLADNYLRLLEQLAPNALHVVDKMPTNFMQVGLIHSALPNARFIHMRRNPIDTCLSIYFQDFGSRISYANDLSDIAHFYRGYLRLMQHWRSILPPGSLLEVPYEALVEEQERWSRKMIEFVGLSWDMRCLDFQGARRSVVTASKWQVRQKISRTSVERWRHYEKHVGPLLPLLQEA